MPDLFTTVLFLLVLTGPVRAFATPACAQAHPEQLELTPEQFAEVQRSYEELAPIELNMSQSPVERLKRLMDFAQLMRFTSPSADIKSDSDLDALFRRTPYDILIHHLVDDCGSLDKAFIALAKIFGFPGTRLVHISTVQSYLDYCPTPNGPHRPLYTDLLTHNIAAIPQAETAQGTRWLIVDPDMAKQIPFFEDYTDFMGTITLRDLSELDGKVLDLPGYNSQIFQAVTGIHTGGGLLVNAVGTSEPDSLCVFTMDDNLNIVASGSISSQVCRPLPQAHLQLQPADRSTWGF